MKAVVYDPADPYSKKLDIAEGGRCWSFTVHYFNGGGCVLGPTPGATFGTIDVTSTGADYGEAWGNAVRLVSEMGHDVDKVTINI